MSIARDYLSGNPNQFPRGKTYPTPQQQTLLEDIKAIEREMVRRKKHYRYSDKENSEYLEGKLFEAKEKYYIANKAVSASINKKIDAVRQRYEEEQAKNATKNLLQLQRWQLMYSNLSEEELTAEAGRYLHGEGDFEPDQLMVLNNLLLQKGVKTVGFAPTIETEDGVQSGTVETHPFQEWMELRHWNEPWRKEVPELYRLLELYDTDLGKVAVLEEGGMISDFRIDECYMEGEQESD